MFSKCHPKKIEKRRSFSLQVQNHLRTSTTCSAAWVMIQGSWHIFWSAPLRRPQVFSKFYWFRPLDSYHCKFWSAVIILSYKSYISTTDNINSPIKPNFGTLISEGQFFYSEDYLNFLFKTASMAGDLLKIKMWDDWLFVAMTMVAMCLK